MSGVQTMAVPDPSPTTPLPYTAISSASCVITMGKTWMLLQLLLDHLQMCPRMTFSKDRRCWCTMQSKADPEYHDTVS